MSSEMDPLIATWVGHDTQLKHESDAVHEALPRLDTRASADALGIMSHRAESWMWMAWSLGGVPVLFAFLLEMYFRVGAATGSVFPFHSPRGRVVWSIVYAGLLLSGVPTFFRGDYGGIWHVVIVVAYVCLMALSLIAIAVLLSLWHGDSI